MSSTFILIVVMSMLHPGLALDKPVLTMKDSSGYSQTSPTDQLFGKPVTIICTSPQLRDVPVYVVQLRTQNSDSSWHIEGYCTYILDDNGVINVVAENNLGFNATGVECGANREYVKFTFPLPLSWRDKYDCLIYSTTTGAQNFSTEFILKSHSKPDTPTILPDSITLDEEEDVTISCYSSGKPVPQLTLQYDGETMDTFDTSTVVQEDLAPLIQNSSVEWTITSASREHDGKIILCKVLSHPYNRVIETQKIIHVVYGPDSYQGPDEEITHNQNEGNIVELNGTMESYPSLSYKWYEQGSANIIGRGPVYEVNTETKETSGATYTYTVVGSNSENNKSANKTFIVKVTKSTDPSTVTEEESTTPKTGGSEQKTSGLAPWKIVLIVVAIVIVAAITIGAIVLCMRRQHPSSAGMSKAAQARRSSDERHETSKYQSSTASLARQDTAGRTAAYHENPTLPMEYRYSQANVEQYAEVIDDMPRSRKPIALEELDMFDGGNGGPIYEGGKGGPMYDGGKGGPMFEEAPPAYADQYRMDPNYSAYSPNAYGASYGAAC